MYKTYYTAKITVPWKISAGRETEEAENVPLHTAGSSTDLQTT